MMRRACLVMAMGVLSACAAPLSGSGATPPTGDWYAIEINGQPVVSANAARRPSLSLQPDSGRVSGFGGCNRLSGPVTLDESSIKFGALMMTRMACADNALNVQESAFAAALNETDRYVVTGDTLNLMRGTDRRVRLVR